MKLILKVALAITATIALIAGTIAFTIEYVVNTVERATSCAVGGAILAPINITIEGVKLTDGFIDGAIGLGGDILSGVGGLVGIGGDDNNGLNQEQLENAAIIVGVGLSRGESPRNIQLALMGPFAESNMINVAHGDRDSLGLYQMRPSQGWGTAQEVMDPVYAANKFYDVLHAKFTQEQIDQRQMWQTVADVLLPAEEYRMRYDEHREIAAAIVNTMVPEAIGTVGLIGDSMTIGMQSSTAFYLQQSGWGGAFIDASEGRTVSPDSSSLVATLVQADNTPGLWIFDLGTDDVVAGLSDAETIAAGITQVIDAVPGDAEIAWVTLHVPGNLDAQTFNNTLREVADERGVRIIDWDGFATENPGLLASDGVHYTAHGNEQRAAFVTRVATDANSGGNSIFGFGIPSACDFGGTVIGGTLDLLTGQIGIPFTGGENGMTSLFEWAFAEGGYDLAELISSGEVLSSFNSARLGDLVLFAEDPSDPSLVTRTGIYLGSNNVIVEPEPGEVTTISRIDWSKVQSIVRISVGSFEEGQEAAGRPPINASDTTVAAGFRVHPAIALQIEGLIAAAEASSINLGGSGWRDSQGQINLRRANCGTSRYAIYEMPSNQCKPPTARPGSSMHERGLALDLTCNGVLITSRGNSCFQWLAQNAESFGLYNLPSEPWHWSVNGK